jgi:hypothetical protein
MPKEINSSSPIQQSEIPSGLGLSGMSAFIVERSQKEAKGNQGSVNNTSNENQTLTKSDNKTFGKHQEILKSSNINLKKIPESSENKNNSEVKFFGKSNISINQNSGFSNPTQQTAEPEIKFFGGKNNVAKSQIRGFSNGYEPKVKENHQTKPQTTNSQSDANFEIKAEASASVFRCILVCFGLDNV